MTLWLILCWLALTSPLLFLLLLDSLLRVFLLVISRLPSAGQAVSGGGRSSIRMAAIIPACNEAGVIADTVARLREQLPDGGLFVIADNCSDGTASAARQGGAQVWERWDADERGKGAALRWFLKSAASELESYAAVAVFDADSVVADDFLVRAGEVLADGSQVVQGFVNPLSGGSPAADLAAYSEILSQRIDDAARKRLGWPAPLRGTGMVFRHELLTSLLPGLCTRVEDVELSLCLAARGQPVRFAPAAVVGDPKPALPRGVATQRARWLQGQREVLQRHGRLVARLLLSGRPGNVSLVFATLLKPKTAVLAVKGLYLAILLLLPAQSVAWGWLATGLAGLAFALDWVYYAVGLALVENRGRYARALAQAPVYFVVWMWGLVLSLVSAQAWLSARRDN